jgi:hypothetical protein
MLEFPGNDCKWKSRNRQKFCDRDARTSENFSTKRHRDFLRMDQDWCASGVALAVDRTPIRGSRQSTPLQTRQTRNWPKASFR